MWNLPNWQPCFPSSRPPSASQSQGKEEKQVKNRSSDGVTATAECGAAGQEKAETIGQEKAETISQVKVEKVVRGSGLAAAADYTATASHPASATVQRGAAGREKVSENPAAQPAQVLAAAAIGTFKSGGIRAKRATRGACAHLTNTRPPWTDANPWSPLLKARRGLQFSVQVIERLLALFRAKGSTPV